MEIKSKPILFSSAMVRAILTGTKTTTRRVIKPQPEGEPVALSEWSSGIARACHDHAPDADRLTAHTERLRGRIFPFCTKHGTLMSPNPPYRPGDRLWVRETWKYVASGQIKNGHGNVRHGIAYQADSAVIWQNHTTEIHDLTGNPDSGPMQFEDTPWRPSIHMFRSDSRITLEVTGVRVERLQEITEEDAIREGLTGITKDGKLVKYGIPDRDGLPGTDNTGWAWQDWCVNPIDAFARLWDSINGKTYPWASNPWVWVTEFRRIPADQGKEKS